MLSLIHSISLATVHFVTTFTLLTNDEKNCSKHVKNMQYSDFTI